MRRARLIILGLIVGLAGFACGDSDDSGDGPMCGDAPTCGGMLKGSWTLADACFIVLTQPKLSFCPTAIAELHAKKSEGSVTFSDDDRYERHVELETELLLKLPATCQGEGDKKKDCSEFDMQLSNGGTLTCASAENEADGCECTASLMSRFNDEGEYTIRGNRVQLVGEELDYCVKGGKLTLRPSKGIDMSGTPVTSQLQTTFDKND